MTAPSPSALAPGATIGILGGGQLGRMLAMAAARMGFHVQIFCPEKNSPAFQVVKTYFTAAYEDETALTEFAKNCDVITYEFENVPAQTVAFLKTITPVLPDIHALQVSQDRLAEREFLASCNIAVAPYASISSIEEAQDALQKVGAPSVLKACRFGYDGKGQAVLQPGEDISDAWNSLGQVPAILEAFIPFELEISVLIARSQTGEMVPYEPGENKHRNHILDTTTIPANISKNVRNDAIEVAKNIAETLNYVGMLAVEMFICKGPDHNALYVNEIAPRVHNSGHWTQNACTIDHFEQHIRAITGWPLGDPTHHSNAVMKNLIADDVHQWKEYAARPNHSLHLYGKTDVRPARKMGHVNIISPKNSNESK